MNKQDVETMQKKLSVLLNQPLCSVSRGGGSIFIHFGELVAKNTAYFTEDKKSAIKKTLAGKYALHIECNSRFICGDKVILAKYDLYEPTSSQAKNEDFDWDNFDWDTKGGNRYDELVQKYFLSNSSKFIVKKVSINRLGDLKICFTNDFALEVIIDTSDTHECWRFFETGSDEHLIVTGQGLYSE